MYKGNVLLNFFLIAFHVSQQFKYTSKRKKKSKFVRMDTLTIIKKFYSTLDDDSRVWTYEFVETGEIFKSVSNDAYAAFLDHVRQRELDEMLATFDPSDVFHEELPLHIATQCPYVPEDVMPKTVRDERIEDSLLRAYAIVLSQDIHDLVYKNCEACDIFDPSQDHHDCLMLSREIRVYRYLSEALQDVDDERVMELFMKNVESST
jgi:hypothetical protein